MVIFTTVILLQSGGSFRFIQSRRAEKSLDADDFPVFFLIGKQTGNKRADIRNRSRDVIIKKGLIAAVFCRRKLNHIPSPMPRFQNPFPVFIAKPLPVSSENILPPENSVQSVFLRSLIQQAENTAADFLRCLNRRKSGNLLCSGYNQKAGICRFRSEQILPRIIRALRYMRVHHAQNIPQRIPSVDRAVIENVKKIIRIKNSGRLHNDSVIAKHAHGNQLRPKPSAVTIPISGRDHLHIACLSQSLRQQRSVHTDCPIVIRQNADTLSLSQKLLHIPDNKRRLPGTKKAGDQIDLNLHLHTLLQSQRKPVENRILQCLFPVRVR